MKIKKLMVLPLILATFTSCELNLGTSGLLSNETTSNVESSAINSNTSQIEQSTAEEIDENLVKLKVWCDPSQTNFIEKTVKKFKNLYPDVEFDFTIEGVYEGDALLEMKIDFDSAADVFHFYEGDFTQLYKKGFLHDFNDDESRKTLNSLGISSACLSGGQIDGKQYAIPYTANTYFMYYDSNVYTKEDVKSVENMLKINVSEKKSSYKYNAAFDFGNSWYGQSILYSSGATVNETTGSFDNAEQGASYLAKCAHNEKLVMAGGTYNIGIDAAAVVTGLWDAAEIKEKLGEGYACAPLPTLNFKDGEVPWKAVGDYRMIGVKSSSQEEVFASRFALFLSSAEIQRDRFIRCGIAPTNEKTLEYPEVASCKEIVAQTQTLANTFTQPSSLYNKNNYWNFYDSFWSELKVADTDEKVSIALQSFNDKLKKSFS
ncbi:MAG: extracellular solute-binding protein [Bacillales bacterium]|nr:extracellular solute-binding protein [Bacillales bacterium]